MSRSIIATLIVVMALITGCASEEEQGSVSSSPRTTFKRTGKLKPIHSGFRSKQTSSTHIKKLITQFSNIDESIRHESLDEIVEIARPAIQYLESALKHKNPRTREYVCIALGRIGRMPGSFMLNKVVALLQDKNIRVVKAACFAIGHIGSTDSSVAKKVFDILSHPDPSLRSYAAECIRKLKYWPAIPALIFNHIKPKAPAKGAKVKAGSPVDINYTNPMRAYAADALAHITHVDFGTNYPMWRKWWIYNQDRYTDDYEN